MKFWKRHIIFQNSTKKNLTQQWDRWCRVVKWIFHKFVNDDGKKQIGFLGNILKKIWSRLWEEELRENLSTKNEIFFVWCKSISTFSNRVLVYYHDFNKENKETATHQSHRLLTNCKISYFPFFLWYMVNKIVSQMGLIKKLNPIWTLFDSVGKKVVWFYFC